MASKQRSILAALKLPNAPVQQARTQSLLQARDDCAQKDTKGPFGGLLVFKSLNPVLGCWLVFGAKRVWDRLRGRSFYRAGAAPARRSPYLIPNACMQKVLISNFEPQLHNLPCARATRLLLAHSFRCQAVPRSSIAARSPSPHKNTHFPSPTTPFEVSTVVASRPDNASRASRL